MEANVYKAAAQSIMRAGQIPFSVNDTLLELLATFMTEDQARFIPIFIKPLNHDELRAQSDLTDEALQTMLDSLMNEGIITGLPSRRRHYGLPAASPAYGNVRINPHARRDRPQAEKAGQTVPTGC